MLQGSASGRLQTSTAKPYHSYTTPKPCGHKFCTTDVSDKPKLGPCGFTGSIHRKLLMPARCADWLNPLQLPFTMQSSVSHRCALQPGASFCGRNPLCCVARCPPQYAGTCCQLALRIPRLPVDEACLQLRDSMCCTNLLCWILLNHPHSPQLQRSALSGPARAVLDGANR